MSYLALENFSLALDGLYARDPSICEQVVDGDQEIDQLEIRIDHAAIDLILLLQPVAKDLRFATMVMKINTNLERVGDQAVFIARMGRDLAGMAPVRDWFGLPLLGERVHNAVQSSMDAFAREDAVLARSVRDGDEAINQTHREMIQALLQFMMENPKMVPQAVELILLAQTLERVADYAKNIADEVIYMVEAVDQRHRPR